MDQKYGGKEIGVYLAHEYCATSVKFVKDLVRPQHFPMIVKSVEKLCGFDTKTTEFAVSTLALKIGYEMKNYAMTCSL